MEPVSLSLADRAVRPKRSLPMFGIYDDHGIRFEYPPTWEIDVSDDGPRIAVTVQSPDGPAFSLITLDTTRPGVNELVEEALMALREEYPSLDARPSHESIDGQETIGHDIEFVSLDMINVCAIRAYRSPRRTIFIMAQWSDVEGSDPESVCMAIRASFEETDS
jgi:hypothetical protein